MLLIGSDGVERHTAKQFLFSTESCQFSVHRHFRLTATLHRWFQPAHELHQCDTIAEHRTPETFYFHRIFNGFHHRNRRLFTHYVSAFHRFRKSIVHLIGIYKDIVIRIMAEGFFHHGIFLLFHAYIAQIFFYGSTQLV